MKYTNRTFSVYVYSDRYGKGWDMVFGASRKGKQMKKCAQDGCNAKVWEHERCVRHRPEDPKIVARRNARRKDPATKTKSNRECPSCWTTNGHDRHCTRKLRTEAA